MGTPFYGLSTLDMFDGPSHQIHEFKSPMNINDFTVLIVAKEKNQ